MSQSVNIIERGSVPEAPIIIAGLPDVGLVGVIAGLHLATSLGMEDVGSIESDLFPPLVRLHKGLPRAAVRILRSGNIILILSETAIPANAVYKLSQTIVRWASEKKARLIISIGGIAVEDRINLKTPRVFATASNEETLQGLKEKSIQILDGGYIVGPYALILKYAAMDGLPAITLLAEAFFNYPDPEAAATAILELNKILGLNIDVKDLLERGEEIRLASRDFMSRTQMEMERMRKSQEYDVPPIHV
ncbi:MAG: proteasome assembly chaperone family protein [Candidatus Bathyarchaeia archaeon]